MKKKLEKKPMGGLTVTVMISIVFTIIMSYGSVTKTILPISFDERWVAMSNLSINSYNSQWMKLVIFILISDIFITLFAILILIIFIRQSRYLSISLIIFFMTRVLVLTLVYYFQTVIKGPPTPELLDVMTNAFRTLIVPGVWIPYIILSEKSREIFVN